MATNLDLDATADATTWNDFFIFADNLLDRCEQSARIINLEFHSAALPFSCLDRVLSILRGVLDQSEDLCYGTSLIGCSASKGPQK